uniref:Uncharacterized protein n=1 Tax=Anguilla anguilla TaxID=7936 RepID=A0A0E9PZU4_ANGAN
MCYSHKQVCYCQSHQYKGSEVDFDIAVFHIIAVHLLIAHMPSRVTQLSTSVE